MGSNSTAGNQPQKCCGSYNTLYGGGGGAMFTDCYSGELVNFIGALVWSIACDENREENLGEVLIGFCIVSLEFVDKLS